ncbi:MAG: hypothetical protein HOM11_12115 [Methylococcales bacterium]|jgi:hypothetical protein|nr:hypothetical protein [Methylococcales bacterium]MBT7443460.1 hypothetical protein [Methylococcales bacterium]
MSQHIYCKRCLSQLNPDADKSVCSNCNTVYNTTNPSTFVAQKNLPTDYVGIGIAAIFSGFLSYLAIYHFFTGDMEMKKMGMSLFFLTPFGTGATLGYLMNNGQSAILKFLLALSVIGAFASLILGAGLAGPACTLILLGIILVPYGLGVMFGKVIKNISMTHLASKLQSSPLILFLLIPIVSGAIEEQTFTPTPIRTVQTQLLIEAPQKDVWKTVRFYEHVKQDPPFILTLGLPIPKKAIGNHKNVGDITSCEYEGGGFIRKKITKIIEHEELTFDVIEQSVHFEHDLKLHGGSILLSPTKDGQHTIITMRTHYETYVRPSWLWEPSMDHVISTLHQYVIQDMKTELGGRIL